MASAGPTPNQIWTTCSCGHIAQEHALDGRCEHEYAPCHCCTKESSSLCSCKMYTGELKTIRS